jgi:hypothetical protein
VLRAVGKDVGHEYVRQDGTVSCYFFMDTPRYPISPSTPPKGKIAHVGERLSNYTFKHTAMLVREPLKTIGSIWATIGVEHQRWLEEFGVIEPGIKPKLLKSMHIWQAVNAACERETDDIYRLEKLVAGGPEWRRFRKAFDLGRVELPDIPPANKSRGIFLARVVTWKDLMAQDQKLTGAIIKMARRYGYR